MQRIEDKRARNVTRTARYLDARLRTIGLDTDALDQQMREQRDRKEREQVRESCRTASWGRCSSIMRDRREKGGGGRGRRDRLV